MGSWWQVKIAGQAAPVWGKNYVPDELMLLFDDGDFYRDTAKLDAIAKVEGQNDDGDETNGLPAAYYRDLIGYRASAGALQQRLQLQGFSFDWVSRLSTAYFEDQEFVRQDSALLGYDSAWFSNPGAITAALTTRAGRATGAGTTLDWRTHPREFFLSEQWRELREAFDDPRFALSLCLGRTHASTEVRIDLTDLVLGGWMTAEEDPHSEARLRMAAVVAADGPVIVITEGASDARRLQRSLEIAAPYVAHLFTFLDFGLNPPGGTDRVVSLTKGMAAAGVMNRIVAVLDNDTAGRDAKAQLSKLNLPTQVVGVCLPDVPYAISYPALGPSGYVLENVNGRAVSMEFMFGVDVLRDTSGELAPVRWHGFNERVADYQGRLEPTAKTVAGQAIDSALSASARGALPAQVEEGCTRLAMTLLIAATAPRRIPASEFSALTATWRRNPFADTQMP